MHMQLVQGSLYVLARSLVSWGAHEGDMCNESDRLDQSGCRVQGVGGQGPVPRAVLVVTR
jgi:hypothetical protein